VNEGAIARAGLQSQRKKNSVVRIFGPKTGEVTGEWRKLHYEELNDLYFSPRVRVVKSRKRWVGM
jgi:hypothetical protein